MSEPAGDRGILDHIRDLVTEEEHLYAKSSMTEEERTRLGRINVELDRCWDLLRQRRALREFGGNPDEAKPRPASIVEKYQG